MSGTDFYYEPQVKLAETIASIVPIKGPVRSFFGNSGTEANEAAIKLARYHSRRPFLIAFLGSFHGRTLGALSLTASKAVQRKGFGPAAPGVFHTPYADCYRCPANLKPDTCAAECLGFLEDQVLVHLVTPDEVAAIVVEPIQGEGGYLVPPKQFHDRLQELARKHGMLIVVDEVQSGMGRTGRMFASENLQNIPIRTELGRQVRNAFVAAPGNSLLSVDYSQVELRIAAHMADDAAMLSAFQDNLNIHTATAAAIYNIPLDAVTKEQRRNAKAINFGLIYGMSAFGLTRSSELTLAESEDFVEAYFRQFPGVKHYLDNIRVLAARQGYVETLLGRRRYFPGLQTEQNQNIRNREEREAINAPIQGTAADIMKIAMLRLPGALRQAGLQASILLQVHD